MANGTKQRRAQYSWRQRRRTPNASLNAQYPNFPLEYHFSYMAVPNSSKCRHHGAFEQSDDEHVYQPLTPR